MKRTKYIKLSEAIHGTYYDYNLVHTNVETTDDVTIICPTHGKFQINSNNHLSGKGCSKCKVENTTLVKRSERMNFIIQANERFEFKYNYEQMNFIDMNHPIQILCPKHGLFTNTPNIHLNHSNGCPKCADSNMIKRLINTTIQGHGISCVIEKTFDGCLGVNLKPLTFDFYIPSHNMCIEYFGIHHYEPTSYINESSKVVNLQFQVQQQNDHIREQYCKNNNIILHRISYSSQQHIDDQIIELLDKQQIRRYMYTYDAMSIDIKKIINYIKSFGYIDFAVYGIARGGVNLSIPISYHFGDRCQHGIITYQRYDGDDKEVRFDTKHETEDIPIFIVDDLISSGETMSNAIFAMKQMFYNAHIHPIVVFGDENEDNIVFIHEHPKQWIIFPYEIQ
jgi:hypoxanthine phosphoribosyltransferase